MSPHPQKPLRHLLLPAFGVFLILCFSGLSWTRTGISAQFAVTLSRTWDSVGGGDEYFTNLAPGEVLFWLGTIVFLIPGGALIGWGLTPFLSPLRQKMKDHLSNLPATQARLLGPSLFTLCVCLARLAHTIIALDRPVTDDEHAAHFGGTLLAAGKVKFPIREPLQAFPSIFLYVRNGFITSMDWLGVQLAWALGELIHSPELVFAIAAALPVPFLFHLFKERLDQTWAIFGVVFFWFIPLSFCLSSTTHAHLLSRAVLAALLVTFWKAWSNRNFHLWILIGFFFGIGILCRPLETVFLSAPFFLDATIRAYKNVDGFRRGCLGILLGLAPVVLGLMLHNRMVTGSLLLPPRLASNYVLLSQRILTPEAFDNLYGVTFTIESIPKRFGSNVGFNLLRVMVFFLGPLGIGLALFGIRTDRFTQLLGFGLILNLLGLGMLHLDFGVHVGGPHHQSEFAVPLVILAIQGLYNLTGILHRFALNAERVTNLVMGAFLSTALTFNAIHGYGVYQQALVQETIFKTIEDSVNSQVGGNGKVVVLAPPFWRIWRGTPRLNNVGTWVMQWPAVSPQANERIIILLEAPGTEDALRKQFPDRQFFRASLPTPTTPFAVTPAPPPS